MKIIFIILFLFLSNSIFGQNDFYYLDKIESNEEAEKLINSFPRFYNEFTILDVKNFHMLNDRNRYCTKLFDSLSIKKAFYKSDFDKNGLDDLLIIGYFNFDLIILVAMNFGQDSIQIIPLTRNLVKNCAIPKIVNDTIIEYNYPYSHSRNSEKYDEILKKSLIYKYNDFIELNNNVTNLNIEKIEFETTGCYGICPVFKIIINQDKTAKFIAEKYNSETISDIEISGEFDSILNEEIFLEIYSLLNYIDFSNLGSNYIVPWSDDQTSILKITYNNGQVKVIEDYGLLGTFGLNRLYQILFDLRFNQDWKKL